jgi:hypothetical protein
MCSTPRKRGCASTSAAAVTELEPSATTSRFDRPRGTDRVSVRALAVQARAARATSARRPASTARAIANARTASIHEHP